MNATPTNMLNQLQKSGKLGDVGSCCDVLKPYFRSLGAAKPPSCQHIYTDAWDAIHSVCKKERKKDMKCTESQNPDARDRPLGPF